MKLIVSDLDGTLLEDDHSISPRTVEMVDKLRELSVLFTIATGRSLTASKEYIERLNISTPVILFNGARIFDPVEGKYLTEHTLSRKAVETIIEKAKRQRDLTVAFFVSEEVYMYNVCLKASTYFIRDAIVYRSVEDLSDFVDQNVTKIVFAGQPYDLDKLEMELPEILEEADVVKSEDDLLEILPKGVNKASALKELCGILRVPLSEVIVLGDSMNDLQMIRVAGFGIAVGKAKDEIRKSAKMYVEGKGEEALQKVYELLRRGE